MSLIYCVKNFNTIEQREVPLQKLIKETTIFHSIATKSRTNRLKTTLFSRKKIQTVLKAKKDISIVTSDHLVIIEQKKKKEKKIATNAAVELRNPTLQLTSLPLGHLNTHDAVLKFI